MRKITVDEVYKTRTGGVQLKYRCDCPMKHHLHGGGSWQDFIQHPPDTTVSFGTRVSHCQKYTDDYELVYTLPKN